MEKKFNINEKLETGSEPLMFFEEKVRAPLTMEFFKTTLIKQGTYRRPFKYETYIKTQ